MRYCPNVSCPGRVLEGIVHFASRDAMDIRGLGYERVRQLLDAGLIENVADLYDLTADQLVELDRFAEQSADAAGRGHRGVEGAPALGPALRARDPARRQDGGPLLARRFGTMDALMTADEEAINDVPGVGGAIAEAVVAFFGEPRNQELIERLRRARAQRSPSPAPPPPTARWSARPTCSRAPCRRCRAAQATELIEAAGGRVAGSVSKKTDAVVPARRPAASSRRRRRSASRSSTKPNSCVASAARPNFERLLTSDRVAMSAQPSRHPRPGLRLGRKVLHQLRAALERDTGLQAASYLQEAGFAGGEELYAEFTEWLLATRGVERPADLDDQFLSEVAVAVLQRAGVGRTVRDPARVLGAGAGLGRVGRGIEEARGEFPSCHLTCGLLADFFGRLSDGLVAVMEVECRSRGDARCRFLAGSPETLSALYDRMAQGTSYADALGISSIFSSLIPPEPVSIAIVPFPSPMVPTM